MSDWQVPGVLGRIASKTRKRVAELKKQQPPQALAAALSHRPRDFRAAFAGPGPNVIAEVKLASPSRGAIAPELVPVDVAKAYLKSGAKALSVLTEPFEFKGDVEYLRQIRAACPEALLLMKDFFVDTYQLKQALWAGADAILVIVAMLGPEGSRQMWQAALDHGLTPLVEVHNDAELDIALGFGAELIGINNRNLIDLNIDLATTEALAAKVPDGVVMIGESGIETREDMERLSAAGCHGFLVGSSLMATGAPGAALAKLIARERP